VAPYCPRHNFHPFTLLFTFEYFLNCLKNQGVGSLNCSVRQWVVYGCERDLRPNLMAKILKHGAIEILGIVDSDLLLNSRATDDVMPEEFLDCRGGYVGNKLRLNPFGEVLHCNYSKSVISLCWCKFTNDADAPPLQVLRWGNQLQRLCRSLGVMGEFLTSFTG
jgi:hypothetical protein